MTTTNKAFVYAAAVVFVFVRALAPPWLDVMFLIIAGIALVCMYALRQHKRQDNTSGESRG